MDSFNNNDRNIDGGITMEMEILIDKVLENRADSNEISLVEEWVAADSLNRKIFEQKRALHNFISHPGDPNEVNVEEALNKLHRAMKRKPRWTDWLWRSAVVAASVLIIIGITVFYNSYDSKNNTTVPIASNEISLCAPYGSLVETTLPDGTKVWLNSNSKIIYPTVFDNDLRQVSIVGEGYFEVKADKKHPFIVATDKGFVRATGTAFNVNAYPDNDLTVVLVSGAVNVKTDIGDYPLKAGECVKINNSLQASLSQADIHKTCSWREGVIIFDNDRLQTVFNRLSQLYPVDFKIVDESLMASRYHATFSGENLDEILHLLEIGIPLRYEEQENDSNSARRLIYVYSLK